MGYTILKCSCNNQNNKRISSRTRPEEAQRLFHRSLRGTPSTHLLVRTCGNCRQARAPFRTTETTFMPRDCTKSFPFTATPTTTAQQLLLFRSVTPTHPFHLR